MAESEKIYQVSIADELRRSYLDYAMSVIVGRALPDVRDGLKPVHRRILYAMSELSIYHNRPYVKSARVVGEVIGKYHPHGDTAAYETLVRMAQDFSMRAPLVDGQGNFGSVDGDPPAAQRYTEVRMARIAGELLADLDKETVSFAPNYDDTLLMPEVLPTRIPNLLVNGSSGIAVGMATNIPPHNLSEVVNACLHLIDNPGASVDDLMQHIEGPDFPTGAIINGRAGIVQAYKTGRGSIHVRSRAEVVEDKKGRQQILVTEIPYQVNKARLIEKIAELVKAKKIEGISEIRDESDKDGLRVVIDIRRGDAGEVVLNNLYAHTQMESVFGINNVALVDGRPRVLNLQEMLAYFLRHRREVVTRRTNFLLRKALERGHILEGQAVALSNIDPVIDLIKNSPNPAEARQALVSRGWKSEHVLAMLAGEDAIRPSNQDGRHGFIDGLYYLSETQAQAILDLRLHRLTGLEQDKLFSDYREILDSIVAHQAILADPGRLTEVLREELAALLDNHGDPRRSLIIDSQHDLTVEDLITEEDMVVTISRGGYAKSQPLADYQTIRRGGRGRMATTVKDEDFVEHLFVSGTHDTILCFSNMGKVYWLKVYQIRAAGRGARGRPLVNMLPLAEGERVTAILPVHEYSAERYIFMATAAGVVKRTPLQLFSRPRKSGLIALRLDPDDQLVGVTITDGGKHVLLVASSGQAVRFRETDVRITGRLSRGVRGIRLSQSSALISMIVPGEQGQLLLASRNGYGKRTAVTDFPTRRRGGMGVRAMRVTDRNGPLVRAVQVWDTDEVMLISDQGTLLRTKVDEISLQGRNTQGVRLINVRANERLAGLERIQETAGGDSEAGEADA